jgi:hypothetical protein
MYEFCKVEDQKRELFCYRKWKPYLQHSLAPKTAETSNKGIPSSFNDLSFSKAKGMGEISN